MIFCDDLGYGDVGCFGSTRIKTPNVDRLAKEGMKLTSFYSTAPVCTPSRSSLMTSCYPRRINMHQNERGGWVLFPGNSRGLSADEATLPEILKSAGYATACIGKWHLGDQPEFLPTRHGFDSYFGIPYSNDMGMHAFKRSKYPPLPLLRDEKVIEKEPDQSQITKRYTEEAIKFVEANKDKPFFLYWPHTFPHWPFYASKEFLRGADKATILHTIEEIDWSVGELMKALKRLGLDDNTLVIFTSDNGGALHHKASNGPLRGGKGMAWEGGMRVPCVARWPGKIPAGSKCEDLCTTMDLLPTFAKLAGAEVSKDRKLDGHDIAELLTGMEDAKTPYNVFNYYRVAQLCAVRSGDWKLHVAHAGGPRADSLPALYNLRTDLGETKNVAKDHPEIVKKLAALAEQARAELGDGRKAGNGQRPAGHVKNAKPLTRRPMNKKQ